MVSINDHREQSDVGIHRYMLELIVCVVVQSGSLRMSYVHIVCQLSKHDQSEGDARISTKNHSLSLRLEANRMDSWQVRDDNQIRLLAGFKA